MLVEYSIFFFFAIKMPAAVNNVICVSSDTSALPFVNSKSVIPCVPYIFLIFLILSNSMIYPNASPQAPPIKHPITRFNLSIFPPFKFYDYIMRYE